MSDHWNGDGERMVDSERMPAKQPESEQVRGRATEDEEFDDAEDLDEEDLDDEEDEGGSSTF
jgi:hypothetical protein